MIRPPQLVLPPGAMPWGRWVQGTEEDNTSKIAEIKNSKSNDFSARADNIAEQIRKIQVATIYYTTLPDWSASVTGGISDPVRNVVSSTYNFTAPDLSSTRCVAILNFRIVATTGEAPDWPIMKVNGEQFSDPAHDVRRPPFVNTSGYYALQGDVPVGPGGAVSVQYGAKAFPLPNSNLSIDEARLWLAFYGSIS